MPSVSVIWHKYITNLRNWYLDSLHHCLLSGGCSWKLHNLRLHLNCYLLTSSQSNQLLGWLGSSSCQPDLLRLRLSNLRLLDCGLLGLLLQLGMLLNSSR